MVKGGSGRRFGGVELEWMDSSVQKTGKARRLETGHAGQKMRVVDREERVQSVASSKFR